MKKISIVLLVVLLVACLLVSVVACDNNNDKTTYTITVTCDDAITLDTIQVKLVGTDGVDATSFASLTNGVATFNVKAGTYSVVLQGLLQNYNVPNVSVTAQITSATVALTPKTDGQHSDAIEFSLTVLKANGKPVSEGLLVQLCTSGEGGTCTNATTDASGVAVYNLKPGTYEVHIQEGQDQWPANSVFDNTTLVTVSEQSTSATVKFVLVATYTITVQYENGNPVVNERVVLEDLTEDSTLTLSAMTDANGVATLVGPRTRDGYVVVLPDCDQEYTYTRAYVDGYEPTRTITLTKRGTSCESRILLEVGVENEFTIAPDQSIWFEFVHKNVAGVYSIESFGNIDTACKHYSGSSFIVEYYGTAEYGLTDAAIDCPVSRQDKSADDKNFYVEFEIGAEYVGEGNDNIYAFKVWANNLSSEQTFTLKITFIKELVYTEIETTIIQATQIKNVLNPSQESVLQWVPYGQGYTIDFNAEDGLYHLNGVDGPVVMVPVSGSKYYPRGLDKDFVSAYYEAGGVGFTLSDGKTYSNEYGQFLQAYALAGNDDGLTPLTEELITFLQGYARLSGLYETLGWNPTLEFDNLYYFACCYYQNRFNEEPYGDGSAEDPYGLVAGEYKFEMSANAVYNCVLYTRNWNDYKITVVGATLSNASGEAVDELIAVGNDTFSIACGENASTVYVKIIALADIPVEEGGALSLGDNTVNATTSGVMYTFTAEVEGDYLITSDNSMAFIYVPFYMAGENGELVESGIEMIDGSVHLVEGQVYTIYCGSMSGSITYVVSIVLE